MTLIAAFCLFFSFPSDRAGLLFVQEPLFAQESKPKVQKISLAYSYELAYHQSTDGRDFGMLVPFVKMLRDKFGVEVELRKLNRDEGFQQVETGEVDFYAMVGLTEKRRKEYLTVAPLYRTEGAVVTRIDRPVQSLIHLEGRKVGLLKDSSLAGTLSTFVDSEEAIVFFPTLPPLLDALENGDVDCIAVIEGMEIEILQRKELRYEFPIGNFLIDRGIIGHREELRPLVEQIDRVLNGPEGEQLRRAVSAYRNEAILHIQREMLSEKIEQVRQRFEVVKMYDVGALYPLCYREDGKFKGLIVDINRIFTDLTGLEVDIGDHGCGEDGMVAALEKLRNGECQVTSGGYANVPRSRGDGLEFSPVLWTDTIRPYSYGRKVPDLRKARVGFTPNLARYFPWENILDQPPVQYGNRANLVDALKKRKLDVVILGDMILNYQYAVLRDYNFKPLDGLAVEIGMHLVYGDRNPELNDLFDEAVRLYPILYPLAYEQWEKTAERANADYIRARETGQRISWVATLALVFLTVAIMLLLYRFVKYDRQIRKLLREQRTIDFVWIDLRSRRIISKGDHPFFHDWGLEFDGSVCSLDKISHTFGRDFEAEYRADMEKMKEEGLNFAVSDIETYSRIDGKKKYYRRFLHRLSDTQLMLCLQDMTAQHESERQEEFLVQLFDAFKEGLLFVGKDLRVLRYNKAMEELFPDHDPTKTYCFDCFRGGTVPCVGCPIRDTITDGKVHSRTEFYDRTGRWLELNSFPIRDPRTGEVDRVLEFVRDVTDQRNRENQLEDGKNFLSAILDASYDGVAAVSDSSRETLVNSRLVEMFDGAGAEFWTNDDPEIRAKHRQLNLNSQDIYDARDRNRETGEPENGTIYFHDGRIYQWRLTSIQTGAGQTDHTRIWTFHDATQEITAAKKIRESEEYLRTLFDTMPCGMGTFQAVRNENDDVVDFLYTGMNKTFEEIVDVEWERMGDKSLLRVFPHVRVMSGDMEGVDLLTFNKAALDGSVHSCMVHNPLRDTYQQIISFRIGPDRIGNFVVDETARLASERAQRQSEEKYRILFDRMPDGLALFDVIHGDNGEPTEFVYSQLNPSLEKIDGATTEMVRGKTLRELLPNVRLLSDDYQPVATAEHWFLTVGRAAMRGEPGAYLTHDEEKNVYFRLTVFSPGPDQLGAFVTDETAFVVASRSLRESEQRINSLFTSMSNGIVLLDIVRDENGKATDYLVSHANPACCKTLGVSLDQWKGRSIMNMYSGDDVRVPEFGDHWWRGIDLAAEGISGTYHVEFLKLKSAPYQELVIFPVGRQQVGMIMYDETYRIRSEQQLKLMQLILDRISHPVFWLYLDGTIQYANDAAAVAWGFPSAGIAPDGPIGDKAWIYDESVSSDNWLDFLDHFKDTKYQQFDTVMRRKDGGLFPAVVTVNLLEQRGTPFFAAAFQDLTDQTRRIKAEQQALAKSSFLDHMSHEIRTPLNGVLGLTDLMITTHLDAQQRKYVDMAKTSGQQLLSIVSNILDYSSIDSGELELKDEEIDLHEMFDSLRQGVLSEIKERKSKVELEVSIHSEVPSRILGDPVRLRQVVFNLLDNALKFTQEGKISLEVSVATKMPDPTIFSKEKPSDTPGRFLDVLIKDTGTGISEEMMSRLFDSFAMGDASFSRKYGGTGLGLPIARGLVHLMGGEVFVESQVGVGSGFRFLVPLRLPENTEPTSVEVPAAPESSSRREPGDISILVVEDNRINRIVTGEILKKAGYRYDFAENGQEACEAVAEKKFDFILMDCQMPIMDGFEATRKIRKMEAGTDERHAAHQGRVPIVALTANALAGDERNCLDAGMDGFCSKPTNAEQLLEVVRRWTE